MERERLRTATAQLEDGARLRKAMNAARATLSRERVAHQAERTHAEEIARKLTDARERERTMQDFADCALAGLEAELSASQDERARLASALHALQSSSALVDADVLALSATTSDVEDDAGQALARRARRRIATHGAAHDDELARLHGEVCDTEEREEQLQAMADAANDALLAQIASQERIATELEEVRRVSAVQAEQLRAVQHDAAVQCTEEERLRDALAAARAEVARLRGVVLSARRAHAAELEELADLRAEVDALRSSCAAAEASAGAAAREAEALRCELVRAKKTRTQMARSAARVKESRAKRAAAVAAVEEAAALNAAEQRAAASTTEADAAEDRVGTLVQGVEVEVEAAAAATTLADAAIAARPLSPRATRPSRSLAVPGPAKRGARRRAAPRSTSPSPPLATMLRVPLPARAGDARRAFSAAERAALAERAAAFDAKPSADAAAAKRSKRAPLSKMQISLLIRLPLDEAVLMRRTFYAANKAKAKEGCGAAQAISNLTPTLSPAKKVKKKKKSAKKNSTKTGKEKTKVGATRRRATATPRIDSL